MAEAENRAMREAGEKAHNAVKSLMAVVDNACKPGGGVKGDWTAQIALAQTAADAAVDAFEAAITAT